MNNDSESTKMPSQVVRVLSAGHGEMPDSTPRKINMAPKNHSFEKIMFLTFIDLCSMLIFRVYIICKPLPIGFMYAMPTFTIKIKQLSKTW